ncbi:MAG: hypothetical protein AAGM67_05825 [Bacteroidota bacterium]
MDVYLSWRDGFSRSEVMTSFFNEEMDEIEEYVRHRGLSLSAPVYATSYSPKVTEISPSTEEVSNDFQAFVFVSMPDYWTNDDYEFNAGIVLCDRSWKAMVDPSQDDTSSYYKDF